MSIFITGQSENVMKQVLIKLIVDKRIIGDVFKDRYINNVDILNGELTIVNNLIIYVQMGIGKINMIRSCGP